MTCICRLKSVTIISRYVGGQLQGKEGEGEVRGRGCDDMGLKELTLISFSINLALAKMSSAFNSKISCGRGSSSGSFGCASVMLASDDSVFGGCSFAAAAVEGVGFGGVVDPD